MGVSEVHFMLCYQAKWKLLVGWSDLTVLWQYLRGHRSVRFSLLTVHRFAEFDTLCLCFVYPRFSMAHSL